MGITTTPIDGEYLRLTIDGAMTVYEASESKSELLAALADGAGLEIDLAGVDEIDTAGLQLLVLTRREGAQAGKPVRLADPSAALLEALDRYGMRSTFELPTDPPR